MQNRMIDDGLYDVIVDMYSTADDEKRMIIAKSLVSMGGTEGFLRYLTDSFQKISKSKKKSRDVFNLLIDYGLNVCDSHDSDVVNTLVFFFIKLLALSPNAASYSRFSQFLTAVFVKFEDDDADKFFTGLKSLPQEVSILPMAYFANKNPQFLSVVFERILSSVDALLSTPSASLWVHAAITILSNDPAFEFDAILIDTVVEKASKCNNISLEERFNLLSASLSFLPANVDESVKIFANLIENQEITKSALIAAKLLVKHLRSKARKEEVLELVLDSLGSLFSSEAAWADELFDFLRVFPPDILRQYVFESTLNENAANFVYSRFGTSDDYKESFNYNDLLFFCSKNIVLKDNMAHAMERLHPEDIGVLALSFSPDFIKESLIFTVSPEHTDKLLPISMLFYEQQQIPVLAIENVDHIFANIASLAIQHNFDDESVLFLLEYLSECRLAENNEVSIQSFKDSINEKRSQNSVAQMIRSIVYKSQRWCTDLSNYLIQQVQSGDLIASLLLVTINSSLDMLNFCIENLINKPQLLIEMFTASAACAPNITYQAMKEYIYAVRDPQSRDLAPEIHFVVMSVVSKMKYDPDLIELIREALITDASTHVSTNAALNAIISVLSDLDTKVPLNSLLEAVLHNKNKDSNLSFLVISAIIKNASDLDIKNILDLIDVWGKSDADEELKSQLERVFLNPDTLSSTLEPFLQKLIQNLTKEPTNIKYLELLVRIASNQNIQKTMLLKFVPTLIPESLNADDSIRILNNQALTLIIGTGSPIEHLPPSQSLSDFTKVALKFITEIMAVFDTKMSLFLSQTLKDNLHLLTKSGKFTTVLYLNTLVRKDPKAFSEKGYAYDLLSIAFNAEDFSIMKAAEMATVIVADIAPADFFKHIITITPDLTIPFVSRHYRFSPLFLVFCDTIFEKVNSLRSEENIKPALISNLIKYTVFCIKYCGPQSKTLSQFLYSIFLILSSIGLLKSPEQFAETLSLNKAIRYFNHTARANVSFLRRDNSFSENSELFFSRLDTVSEDILIGFIDLSNDMHKTIHSKSAASLAVFLISSRTILPKSIFPRVINSLFSLIQSGLVTDESLLLCMASILNKGSISLLLPEQVTILLTVAMKLLVIDPVSCLRALKLISTEGDPELIKKQAGNFIASMRTAIESKKIEESDISVLEILLNVSVQRRDPTWFMRETPLSFFTLIPLLIKGIEPSLVKMILNVILIGGEVYSDELLFSSLCSLFVSTFGDLRRYIMVVERCLAAAQTTIMQPPQIKVFHDVAMPLIAFDDKNAKECTSKISAFLKNSLKHASGDTIPPLLSFLKDMSSIKRSRRKSEAKSM